MPPKDKKNKKDDHESSSDEDSDPFEGHDGNTDFNFKFILVGESAVGKTSIIQQFINKKFTEEHNRST